MQSPNEMWEIITTCSSSLRVQDPEGFYLKAVEMISQLWMADMFSLCPVKLNVRLICLHWTAHFMHSERRKHRDKDKNCMVIEISFQNND